jgi:hypothetical protein
LRLQGRVALADQGAESLARHRARRSGRPSR